ncbi:hypothetical protein [Muricoccus pecuniae]|uniref:Uncharacterized protein n=1 Tax=Muricoccus pecuniae TaxID=693023 RepID=A0A840YEX0_9PROT|nr:hypothetical protein [Roseomonas pecuniae]MBB5693042.1 hypothetical protein [Roseomonas pecuniae]
MTNVALNTMAYLAPDAVKLAAEQAGIGTQDAERLHKAMLTAAAELRAQAAEWCGILRDPDGPEPLAAVPGSVATGDVLERALLALFGVKTSGNGDCCTRQPEHSADSSKDRRKQIRVHESLMRNQRRKGSSRIIGAIH